MKKLTLEEIKAEELRVLVEIDEICNNEGINYSLAGGTLLGAIRHKGFIPWDDDIDIFMLRRDYDRFLDFCNNNDNQIFKIINHDIDLNYNNMFCIASSKRTIVKEQRNYIKNVSDKGCYVDIFPVDFLDDSFDKSVKLIESKRNYIKILSTKNFSRLRLENIKFKSKVYGIYLYSLSKLFSYDFLKNKILYSLDNTETKYVGCLFGYGIKEILEKEVFDKYITVPFEGFQFKSIADYDIYLTNLYGDYMKLPPENERKGHHFIDAYYKD